MAAFTEVAAELRQFLLPGIHGASGADAKGIADWTKGGSYGVSVTPVVGFYQLDPVMPNVGLAEAFASEVRRFSLAAYETCLQNERAMVVQRALAWPIITNYYAAYFSAHAICRLFGRSVSQLDSTTSNSVGLVVASYLGGEHAVGSGLHAVTFDPVSSSVQYKKNSGSGGSHELLWKVFLDLLDHLQTEILRTRPSTTEVQGVAAYLSEVATRLKIKGANGGNWLSVLRNEVNYRQQYGVWYPYGVTTSASNVVSRRLHGWLRERTEWSSVVGRNTELNCAADLAGSLLSLLFWLLKDLASRSTASRHFVNGSTFALLRQQVRAPSTLALIGV